MSLNLVQLLFVLLIDLLVICADNNVFVHPLNKKP